MNKYCKVLFGFELLLVTVFAVIQTKDIHVRSAESLLGSEERKLPELKCDNLNGAENELKLCEAVKKAMEKLEDAIKDGTKGANVNELKEKLGELLKQHMVPRVKRLQEILSKLNLEQGMPGLMESFRVFGIPLSKLYALYMLLDPFEI